MVEVLAVEVDALGEVEEELPEFWLVEALVADSDFLVSALSVELSLDEELELLSVDLLLELLPELLELSDVEDIDVEPLTPFWC